MKTVLAFGDSLTWGLIPGTRQRYPRDIRWPKVLENELNGKAEVIENGLNARTTVHENPFRDGRKGLDSLPISLEHNAPLDLVILMLGSNDFHNHYALTPPNIARGMRRLVQLVKTYETEPGMPVPEILVVSPPRLSPTDDAYYAPLFRESHKIFSELAPLYELLAKDEDVHFFDAGGIAKGSDLDGVHLSAEDTRKIGLALTPVVKRILSIEE